MDYNDIQPWVYCILNYCKARNDAFEATKSNSGPIYADKGWLLYGIYQQQSNQTIDNILASQQTQTQCNKALEYWANSCKKGIITLGDL